MDAPFASSVPPNPPGEVYRVVFRILMTPGQAQGLPAGVAHRSASYFVSEAFATVEEASARMMRHSIFKVVHPDLGEILLLPGESNYNMMPYEHQVNYHLRAIGGRRSSASNILWFPYGDDARGYMTPVLTFDRLVVQASAHAPPGGTHPLGWTYVQVVGDREETTLTWGPIDEGGSDDRRDRDKPEKEDPQGASGRREAEGEEAEELNELRQWLAAQQRKLDERADEEIRNFFGSDSDIDGASDSDRDEIDSPIQAPPHGNSEVAQSAYPTPPSTPPPSLPTTLLNSITIKDAGTHPHLDHELTFDQIAQVARRLATEREDRPLLHLSSAQPTEVYEVAPRNGYVPGSPSSPCSMPRLDSEVEDIEDISESDLEGLSDDISSESDISDTSDDEGAQYSWSPDDDNAPDAPGAKVFLVYKKDKPVFAPVVLPGVDGSRAYLMDARVAEGIRRLRIEEGFEEEVEEEGQDEVVEGSEKADKPNKHGVWGPPAGLGDDIDMSSNDSNDSDDSSMLDSEDDGESDADSQISNAHVALPRAIGNTGADYSATSSLLITLDRYRELHKDSPTSPRWEPHHDFDMSKVPRWLPEFDRTTDNGEDPYNLAAHQRARVSLIAHLKPLVDRARLLGLQSFINYYRQLVPRNLEMALALAIFFFPKNPRDGCPYLHPVEELDVLQARAFFSVSNQHHYIIRALDRVLAFRLKEEEADFATYCSTVLIHALAMPANPRPSLETPSFPHTLPISFKPPKSRTVSF
ncbi:hypothetical protein BC629DRAFT_1444111 [Irpex lacteus]|nr:hypothetical protein BC629DRAFT_1444111 [Irpex lacteus]